MVQSIFMSKGTLVTRTSRNNDKLLYKLNKRRPRIEMMDVETTSVCYFWVPILFRLFDITCQYKR